MTFDIGGSDGVELLSIPEFRKRYSIGSRSKVYDLSQRGEIVLVKVGRVTRVTSASAKTWAAHLPRVHKAAQASNTGVPQ